MTHPHARRRSGLIAVGLTALFALVALLVVTAYPPLMAFDHDVVAAWTGAVQDTPWHRFFTVVAAVTNPWVQRSLMLLLTALLLLKRGSDGGLGSHGRGRQRRGVGCAQGDGAPSAP